jgi:hypothetical protein
MGAYGGGFGQGGVGYEKGVGAVGRAVASIADKASRAAAGTLTADESAKAIGAALGALSGMPLGLMMAASGYLSSITPPDHLGEPGTDLNSGTDNLGDVAQPLPNTAQLPTVTPQPPTAAAQSMEQATNSNNFRIETGTPEWTRTASQQLERAIAQILNTQPTQRRAFSRLPLTRGIGERLL